MTRKPSPPTSSPRWPRARPCRRRPARRRPVELGRWAWRQLTSMRTALVLLFLLALAAIPGSVVPQEAVDSLRASRWQGRPPEPDPGLRAAGPVRRLRLAVVRRDLPAAVVSLVGCIVPRSAVYWRAFRAQPPRAPRHLGRLPDHRRYETADAPDDVLDRARSVLRARRYRIRDISGDGPVEEAGDAVSAERGLPARGRQPALPHLGAGRAGRLRDGLAVRVQGRRDRGDRRRLLQHPQPVRRLRAGPCLRPRTPSRRSASRSTTSTSRSSARAARPGRPRSSSPTSTCSRRRRPRPAGNGSRSTTRSPSTAPRCS